VTDDADRYESIDDSHTVTTFRVFGWRWLTDKDQWRPVTRFMIDEERALERLAEVRADHPGQPPEDFRLGQIDRVYKITEVRT
jgi:hypothetical protein